MFATVGNQFYLYLCSSCSMFCAVYLMSQVFLRWSMLFFPLCSTKNVCDRDRTTELYAKKKQITRQPKNKQGKYLTDKVFFFTRSKFNTLPKSLFSDKLFLFTKKRKAILAHLIMKHLKQKKKLEKWKQLNIFTLSNCIIYPTSCFYFMVNVIPGNKQKTT